MSDLSAVSIITRERVDNIAARNGEPSWLKDLRLKAWEAYLKSPMPTGRDEDWRTTQIDRLNLCDLQAVDISSGQSSKLPTADWLKTAIHSFADRAGVVGEGASDFAQAPTENLIKQGVIFCSMQEALQKHASLLKPLLEENENRVHDKFAAMNEALFNAGAFLYVPQNTKIDQTFVVVNNLSRKFDTQAKFDTVGSNPTHVTGAAIFPRLVVVLETASQANLVNIMTSSNLREEAVPVDNAISLCNASIEVYLRDGARLNYLELQKFDEGMFAVTRCRNVLGRDANLFSLTVGLSGYQLKSDITTDLVGTGANSDVLGIIFGDKNECFSFNTIQDHDAPSCRSNINFKVVLKDQASSIYQGIIKVAKVAQKTDAFQSNKNLLLGTQAKADSIPKLEILADDVKCSHGATVGPVDREQVFYLMSRGLTSQEAEELIVGGFVRQVLESCPIAGAIEWIDGLMADKIHSAGQAQHA
jgi:Fe-S cluster assembly protein SufD